MNIFQRLISYFRHAHAELLKVVWPSKEDVTRYTILIVAVSVVAAIFFATLDSGLNSGISTLLNRRIPTTTQSDVIIPEDSLEVTPESVEATDVTPANTLTAPAATTTVGN